MKTKHILIAKILVAAVCAVIVFAFFPDFTLAKQSLPLGTENYGEVITPVEGTNVTAIDKLKDLLGLTGTGGGVFGIVRVIVGAVAVLMIILSAVQILTAGGNEETIKKQTHQLMYGILGLLLISLSTEAMKIFSVEKGSPLGSPQEIISRVIEFNKTTQIVITFFKYLIGGIAVIVAVSSGLHLITLEDESKLEEDKKKLLYSVVGFTLIVLSNTLVKNIFYKIDTTAYTGVSGVQPAIDPTAGVKQIVGITNYIVNFVGPLAVLALIVGAIMYMTAGGEEERMNKAKRVIIAAAIGIIVVYGAFAIVSTVIARKFTG